MCYAAITNLMVLNFYEMRQKSHFILRLLTYRITLALKSKVIPKVVYQLAIDSYLRVLHHSNFYYQAYTCNSFISLSRSQLVNYSVCYKRRSRV